MVKNDPVEPEMELETEPEVDVIDLEGFKILHVKADPSRIEAKIIFDRDHISQRLIFTLMDITHSHGFGCSSPIFRGAEDPSMTFMIGTFLPSIRSKSKFIKKLLVCLLDIREFSHVFLEQLDFSRLDLTMFAGIDLNTFYPEQLAAVRDQHYEGSWEMFYKVMHDEQRLEEAEVIKKCREFEHINGKDIGLVGHKLNYILNMLDESLGNGFEVN